MNVSLFRKQENQKQIEDNIILSGHDNLRMKSHVVLWILAVCVCAISGPFGAFLSMGFPQRFAFWLITLTGAMIVAEAIRRIIVPLIEDRSYIVFDAMIVGLMTLSFSPVAYLITSQVFTAYTETPNLILVGRDVFLLTTCMMILRRCFLKFRHLFWIETEMLEGPLLQRKIDLKLGRIMRLHVENHNVHIIAEHGRVSVRMSLNEAILEMSPVEGQLTHRAHWVAAWAINTNITIDGRLYLELVNGDLVPISRTYRPELEGSGLLRMA